MEPLSLGLAFLAAWLVLHLWLLPLAVDRWKAAALRAKMTRAGTLAVLEKLRDLSGVGALTMGAVTLLVGVLAPMSGTSLAMPRAFIAAMAGLYEGTRAFGEQYAGLLGGLAFVAAVVALWMAARQARQRVSTAWHARAREVFTRLRDDPAELGRVLEEPALATQARLFQEVSRAFDAATTDAEKARLSGQLSALLSSVSVHVAEREVDFAEEIGKSSTPDAPRRGWRGGWQFATSRQFGKDIGLLRKPLGYVTTALMLVTLVSWSAEPMADSLRLSLNNLRVAREADEARRDMEAALTRAAESATATPDATAATPPSPLLARTVAHQLARAAVDDMIRSGLLDHAAGVEAPSHAVDASYVRQALLGEELAAGDGADDATRLRAQVAREVAGTPAADAAGAGTRKAEEHAAEVLQPTLEHLQRQNPGALERLHALLQARYADAYTPFDAQGKLMERLMEVALHPADLHPGDEIGRQAQKLVKDFGSTAVRKWMDASLERFVTDQLVEATRGEVLARVDVRLESSEQARALIERVRRESLSGFTPSAAARADREMAQSVADAVAQRYRVSDDERVAMARSLSGYEGVFPKEDAAAAGPGDDLPPTAAGPHEPTSPGGGGGGGGAGGGGGGGGAEGKVAGGMPGGEAHAPRAPGLGEVSARPVSRAISTNFRLASLSFRARGVLVGQPLEGRAAAVTDLRWTVLPRTATGRTPVRLELAEGTQWHGVGVFDAAVVNQALRYAADGRVVATTITPGDDHVIARLTALHPVLADTPLGCRVVESDRLIDTFTFERALAPLAPAGFDQLREDREAMARWLQRVRIAEAVGIEAAQTPSCPGPAMGKALAALPDRSGPTFSPVMRRTLAAFLDARDGEHQASTAFLRQASACALGESSDFVGCACRIPAATRTGGAYWMPEDHTSQFREREARLGDDLAWLRRTPDRLGNVDLVVHSTFAAHRATQGGASTVDEHVAAELLFPPEELATLREAFARVMPVYLRLQLHSDNESFLGPVEDFVLVQRIARAALEGQFADGFPTSRLVALERATHESVPAQPTIRWEPYRDHPDLLEETLARAGRPAAQSYAGYREDAARRQREGRATCDGVTK